MSKKKKGVLPSIEIIIILVFFLCFILWAVSKCGATKATYPSTASEEENKEQSLIDSITMIPLQPKELPLKEEPVSTTPTTATTTNTGQSSLSKLYITIDGLKLRTAPKLNSEVIMTFALFDEVYFLNEVTDSTYQISLGKENADEPWVKVQSKRGKVGWVYGAGVNYYRKKRAGVQ